MSYDKYIITDSWIANKLLPKDLDAIVLFRKIHLRSNVVMSDRFLVHELVHIEQQRNYGMIPFVIKYLIDYIKGLIVYRDRRMAYLMIPFEIEARCKSESKAYRDFILQQFQ